MHALSVSLLRAKQLPVITNGLGASPHAGSTCTIGVVTVRPLNRLPARLYFKLKPDPNNTFFFIFTCTTQYPWVLANLNLSQAMAPSKKKRIHTVFRDSSAHRSALTSKPRFVGEKVKLGELISKAKVERCGDRSFPVYSMTMHDGIVEQSGRFKKTIASRDTSSYKVVKKNQLVVGFPIDEGVIYVQNHDQPGIMSPAYNVWDFDSDRILPAYLEFVLHSPQSMAYYAEKMRGTTARRRTLTGDALKNMPVPVPSIEDQYAVVKALNCIKSQLAATQQMLDKLDQLGKSRFVEMFSGVDQTRPLEKLIVPKTRISYGIVQPGPEGTGDMGILRPVDIVDGRLCLKGIKRIDRKIGDSYRRTELTGNEILTVVRGATGQTVRSEANCIGMNVTRGIAVIRYDPSLIDPDYLVSYMNSDDGQRYIADHTQGATLQQINIADLKAMPIPAPSLKSQQRFAAFAAQVDKSRFVRDHEMNFR